jgi:hypothetical protein
VKILCVETAATGVLSKHQRLVSEGQSRYMLENVLIIFITTSHHRSFMCATKREMHSRILADQIVYFFPYISFFPLFFSKKKTKQMCRFLKSFYVNGGQNMSIIFLFTKLKHSFTCAPFLFLIILTDGLNHPYSFYYYHFF